MKKGGIIVLLGADGCGKSTIADLLIKQLKDNGRDVMHQHWRPTVLPSPRVLFGERPNGDPAHPHRGSDHPLALSLVLSLYYWMDFWIGHFIQVRPFIQRGGIVVAERYIFDMLVDPRRHRLRGPEFWLSLLCRMAPQPNLIIALSGDPQVFYSRKKELKPEEIVRQQEKIVRCLEKRPQFRPVNTSENSIKDSVDSIMNSMRSKGLS